MGIFDNRILALADANLLLSELPSSSSSNSKGWNLYSGFLIMGLILRDESFKLYSPPPFLDYKSV